MSMHVDSKWVTKSYKCFLLGSAEKKINDDKTRKIISFLNPEKKVGTQIGQWGPL